MSSSKPILQSIKQEIESVEETLDQTPLFLIHLELSLLFSDSLVLSLDSVLRENDFLADFLFFLFREIALLLCFFPNSAMRYSALSSSEFPKSE